MHLRTVALAVLACAFHAAAEPKPYKASMMMPVPGLSLLRRDTNGYAPEMTHCSTGSTCAEACGAGFVQCSSNSGSQTHCYNPGASQSCCSDGNACDPNYYCSADASGETFCCPDSMDLQACAAAYTITGGLHTAVATTSLTSTSTSTSTSSKPTSTSAPMTTAQNTTMTTMTACGSSLGHSTAWVGVNSTISTKAPVQPSETTPLTKVTSAATQPGVPSTKSAAGANSVSALLLAAVGVLAFV